MTNGARGNMMWLLATFLITTGAIMAARGGPFVMAAGVLPVAVAVRLMMLSPRPGRLQR